MDTNLNLYPDKMIAQCINAISLLSEANEALNSLKFEINEFVNDSYIHSVSFDELKKQCQNYATVIDAMINCNEADIADFAQLQVDVGSEELIGAIIDKWERYYNQKIQETRQNYENTKGMVSGYARVQMESYYANMIQMYETLYQQWYQKELLYYEIDGKTSSLFAKSYGRQAITNMLAGLKTSFTLNDGYNANVVAAQRADIEEAITVSVNMDPSVIEDTARVEMTKKNRERVEALRKQEKNIEEAKDIEILAAIDTVNQNSKYDKTSWNSYSLAEREQALQDYYDEIVSVMGLSEQKSDMAFETIKPEGSYINHGSHHSDENCIYINEYWIDPNNNYPGSYSAYKTVVHECRHAYQREVIANPEKFEVSLATRNSWEKSYKHYKTQDDFHKLHPLWSYDKCYEEYRKQTVEDDARKIAGQLP